MNSGAAKRGQARPDRAGRAGAAVGTGAANAKNTFPRFEGVATLHWTFPKD